MYRYINIYIHVLFQKLLMYASYVFIIHPYVWFYMYCMFVCMPSKNKSTAYGVCRHAYDHMHVDTYVHRYICPYPYLPTYLPTFLNTYLPTHLPTYIHTYIQYIYPYIDTDSQDRCGIRRVHHEDRELIQVGVSWAKIEWTLESTGSNMSS